MSTKGKKCNNSIFELFDVYCNWRLKEAKTTQAYDYCIEQFAKTELFQIDVINSNYTKNGVALDLLGQPYIKDYDEFALPFERQFVKFGEINGVIYTMFIGEFAPKIITGTLFTCQPNSRYYQGIAFQISEDGHIHVDMISTDEEFRKASTLVVASSIEIVGKTLSNLGKYTVIQDKPNGHTKYYKKKDKKVIKVVDRPIYYVLHKKYEKSYTSVIKNPIGNLSYTHAFKVRGHWRTFNSNSLGKNREGLRVVKGYTWVKEYLKGEGELKKKLRIIK